MVVVEAALLEGVFSMSSVCIASIFDAPVVVEASDWRWWRWSSLVRRKGHGYQQPLAVLDHNSAGAEIASVLIGSSDNMVHAMV